MLDSPDETRPPRRLPLFRFPALFVSAYLAACGVADAGQSERGHEYRPSSELTRLASVPLHGDDIGLVRDFDMVGDTIFLLDGMGRVSVIVRDGPGYRLSAHFSRQGSGPGELSRPSSIARVRDDLVIADGMRLHYFDLTGRPRDQRWLDLPCPMMLPGVAPARAGLFVFGGCMRRGIVADTMKAVLAWLPDADSLLVVTEAVRFTSDGSIGSAFGATSLLTTGTAGMHAFGGGETNCIWMVADDGGRPEATARCPAVSMLYSAEPPPEVAERLRTTRIGGMKLRWPDALPAFTERFLVDGDVVLLRTFTADSLVLQAGDPASRDIAVAPHDGLVGCKASGCVWVIESTRVPRLIVLDRPTIEQLLRGAR